MISPDRCLLFLVLATNAGCARVQHGRPFDPLGAPTGPLLCRSETLPATAPPGSVAFQFENGTELINDRLIGAVYDSLGLPLVLFMTATEKPADGRPIMHALTAAFPIGKPATGFQLVSRPGDDTRTDPPRETLSPTMIGESRSLMVWLWNHRCNKGPTQ